MTSCDFLGLQNETSSVSFMAQFKWDKKIYIFLSDLVEQICAYEINRLFSSFICTCT